MKINSIRQINPSTAPKSFGSGVIVKIPKEFYSPNITREMVKEDFIDLVQQVNSPKPKSRLLRFFDAVGLGQHALLYANFPGYEHLKPFYENGFGSAWIRNRFFYKYNVPFDSLNPKVPDLSENEYHFYLLTGKEKDKALGSASVAKKESKKFFNELVDIVTDKSDKEIDDSDITLLKGIAYATVEEAKFHYATNFEHEVLRLESPDEIGKLPQILQEFFYDDIKS